jgi:hypothetical protein
MTTVERIVGHFLEAMPEDIAWSFVQQLYCKYCKILPKFENTTPNIAKEECEP